MTVRFASGAYGVLQVSAVEWEGTRHGRTQHVELHGSHGTLYSTVDWDHTQSVRGVQGNETELKDLPIPDALWNGARRDTVHNTYRDVLRQQDNMAREFITAIVEDKPVYPDFAEGARVQSANNGCCWVAV